MNRVIIKIDIFTHCDQLYLLFINLSLNVHITVFITTVCVNDCNNWVKGNCSLFGLKIFLSLFILNTTG